MLFRNTRAVRAFFWAVQVSVHSSQRLYEQDLANFLLLKKLKPPELAWGLLPATAVTSDVAELVAGTTVAFHSVGVSGAAKLDRLEAAKRHHSAQARVLGAASRDSSNAAGSGARPRQWMCAKDVRQVSLPDGWAVRKTPTRLAC